MNNRSLLIVSCLLFFNSVFSQSNNYCKVFLKLSRPEKCWTLRHPFIAKKAYKLTSLARKASDSLKQTSILDRDASGGQVDAFRHSYWMLLLSMKFNSHKAISLGKAHEKGNYIDYKKHKTYEDGTVPDSINSQMDLYNNLKGKEIALKLKAEHQKLSNLSLQKTVIDSILSGKMMIIKKNKKAEFLDKNGNIIPAENLINKWYNNKSLVPSSFIRPD